MRTPAIGQTAKNDSGALGIAFCFDCCVHTEHAKVGSHACSCETVR